MQRKTVELLQIPIDVLSSRDVETFVQARVERREPAQIATVNAEFIVLAQRHGEFAQVLKDAALRTPDSAGVLWALGRQGVHLRERVGGSDLIWSLSAQAAALGQRVFLLGGAEGVAAAAAARLQREYPGLFIAGTASGSPAAEDEGRIVDLIRRSRADMLFVAFGAPQQELWIARNLRATGVSVAMGVGGSLDYLAGAAHRAPGWMRDRGMEWLWRLLLQPRRWRRVLALPRFAWLIWQEERSHTGNERKVR